MNEGYLFMERFGWYRVSSDKIAEELWRVLRVRRQKSYCLVCGVLLVWCWILELRTAIWHRDWKCRCSSCLGFWCLMCVLSGLHIWDDSLLDPICSGLNQGFWRICWDRVLGQGIGRLLFRFSFHSNKASQFCTSCTEAAPLSYVSFYWSQA